MGGDEAGKAGGGIMVFCNHYNGTALNKVCKAGVVYHDVRDASGPGRYKFPCFREDGVASRCPLCAYPSEEEIARQEEEMHQAAMTVITRLIDGKCTVCGGEVTSRQKIGRCVYGYPCGHRMYQGGLGE